MGEGRIRFSHFFLQLLSFPSSIKLFMIPTNSTVLPVLHLPGSQPLSSASQTFMYPLRPNSNTTSPIKSCYDCSPTQNVRAPETSITPLSDHSSLSPRSAYPVGSSMSRNSRLSCYTTRTKYNAAHSRCTTHN